MPFPRAPSCSNILSNKCSRDDDDGDVFVYVDVAAVVDISLHVVVAAVGMGGAQDVPLSLPLDVILRDILRPPRDGMGANASPTTRNDRARRRNSA